jgi:hypothetical protein
VPHLRKLRPGLTVVALVVGALFPATAFAVPIARGFCQRTHARAR